MTTISTAADIATVTAERPRFFRATAGNGMGAIFYEGHLSTGAHWGLSGLWLDPKDGPFPDAPRGSYAGVSGRSIARGEPGLYTRGDDEVPMTTVRNAAARLLKVEDDEKARQMAFAQQDYMPEEERSARLAEREAWWTGRERSVLAPKRALVAELDRWLSSPAPTR